MSGSEQRVDGRREDLSGHALDEQVRVDVDGEFKRDLEAAVEESEYYSLAAAVRGELGAFVDRTEVER